MKFSPLIKVDNISFSVNNIRILQNVSLEIFQNDFIVLLGPSGSGKSTLLRLLNGLNSPTAGTVYFHGKSLPELDIIQIRQQVGMVFQSPAMINGTVKENLLITNNWLKDNQSITDVDLINILEKVELNATFLEKDARSLSGGEQQRIALARTLLNKPEVLLLDEPTANLDPQLAQKILHLIYNLHKQLGLVVVLVTHHHQAIKSFVNRAFYLIDGEIIETGSAAIIDEPKSVKAQNFIAMDSK